MLALPPMQRAMQTQAHHCGGAACAGPEGMMRCENPRSALGFMRFAIARGGD